MQVGKVSISGAILRPVPNGTVCPAPMSFLPASLCRRASERPSFWVVLPLLLAVGIQALLGVTPLRKAMAAAQPSAGTERGGEGLWAFWLDPSAICSPQGRAAAFWPSRTETGAPQLPAEKPGKTPGLPAGHAHGDVCFLCPLGKLAVLPVAPQVPPVGQTVQRLALPVEDDAPGGLTISHYFARGPPAGGNRMPT